MKTNIGLVTFVEKAFAEKWGYVWGTYGQILTEPLLRAKVTQYPDMVGRYQTIIRQKWMNRRTVDCIGLIKTYMWYNENLDMIAYDPITDVNVGGMINSAKDKGLINTMPEIPGLAVYMQGHIGIYIGNGQVIEAHNTTKGVIQTTLRGNGSTPWTGWLMIPYINYIGVDNLKPILKLGSKGEAVKELQKGLIKLEYNLGIYGADGDFGSATDTAVKAFQKAGGLVADGIVGEATWAKLDELLKPKMVPPSNDADKYKAALLAAKEIIDTALGK